jgi:hypothetical protein
MVADRCGNRGIVAGGAGSERPGFVDQHDGDPVFHWIDETAGVANQSFGRDTILQIALALGTDQDLE